MLQPHASLFYGLPPRGCHVAKINADQFLKQSQSQTIQHYIKRQGKSCNVAVQNVFVVFRYVRPLLAVGQWEHLGSHRGRAGAGIQTQILREGVQIYILKKSYSYPRGVSYVFILFLPSRYQLSNHICQSWYVCHSCCFDQILQKKLQISVS